MDRRLGGAANLLLHAVLRVALDGAAGAGGTHEEEGTVLRWQGRAPPQPGRWTSEPGFHFDESLGEWTWEPAWVRLAEPPPALLGSCCGSCLLWLVFAAAAVAGLAVGLAIAARRRARTVEQATCSAGQQQDCEARRGRKKVLAEPEEPESQHPPASEADSLLSSS